MPATMLPKTGIDALSPRERQVFELFLEGHRWKEIAYRLEMSPKTVDSHRVSLMRKLGAANAIDLVKLGIRQGLITLEAA